MLNSFPAERQLQVVTTSAEFDSVDFILRSYEAEGRIKVTWIDPTIQGGIPVFDR